MRTISIFFVFVIISCHNTSVVNDMAKPGTLNSNLRSEKRVIKSQTQILRFSTSFYDTEGRIIRDEIYRRNGSVESLYEYEYNSRGKLEFLRMNGNDIRYYNDAGDSIIKAETYDKKGNLEEITRFSYTENGKVAHDETGDDSQIKKILIKNIVSNHRLIATEHSDEGVLFKTIYSYDTAGNKILEKSFENNDLAESHKFEYKSGKLVREEIDGESITIKTYNDKGQLAKTVSGNTAHYFTYDPAGRLVSAFDYYDNKLREITRYTFEYY
jgi:YD repeat-containing protein